MIQHERERIAQLVFYGLVLLLAYLVYQVFRPFLNPLAWAGVLVICFHPQHVRHQRRFGTNGAALATTLAVTIVVIGPMLLVVSLFVSESARMLANVPSLLAGVNTRSVDGWWRTAMSYVPGGESLDVASIVTDAAKRLATLITTQATAILQNTVLFVVNLVITIFAMFFLFRDAASIMRGVRQVLPLDAELRERMLEQTRTLVMASVTAGLIVASVQGLLGGVMFWLFGLGAPAFWGVVMGLFCLLPFGAWVVWGPAALWLVLTGDVTRGLLLAGAGLGIVSAVDNILRPVLLSGRSPINGLLLFISILGGVGAFGAVGLVLGPILMATAVGLFDAYASGTRA